MQLAVSPGRGKLNVMVPVAQVVELLEQIAALTDLPISALEPRARQAELEVYRYRMAFVRGVIRNVARADNPAAGLLVLPDSVQHAKDEFPADYDCGPGAR